MEPPTVSIYCDELQLKFKMKRIRLAMLGSARGQHSTNDAMDMRYLTF